MGTEEKDNKITQKPGTVSALSLGTTGAGWVKDPQIEGDGNTNIYTIPYSHTMYNLSIENIANNYKPIAQSQVNEVIEDIMAYYYTDDNKPATATVAASLDVVIRNSMNVVATIFSLYKMQNQRKLTDEYDREISVLLNHDVNLPADTDFVSLTTADQKGSFSITNVVWAQEYLDKLHQCKLSKAMAQELGFLLLNSFKLQRDDATLRLVSIIPDGVDFTSHEVMQTYLNNQIEGIKGEIAKFPYMTRICEELGLTSEFADDFDLTRDLKGKTIHVWEDKYGDFEAMVYAVSSFKATDDYVISSKDGIVSKPTSNTNFRSNELDIEEHIDVDIVSLSNMLRGGCLFCSDISWMTLHFDAGTGLTTYSFACTYPFVCETEAGYDPDAAVYRHIVKNNAMNYKLDNVGSPFQIMLTTGGNYRIVMQAGVADYYMNAGDIRLVRAIATASVLFANAKAKAMSKFSYITQTINDPGKTS